MATKTIELKVNEPNFGDCMKYLEKMDNNCVQTIYFDPPFNSNRNYKLNEKLKIGFDDKWKNDDEYAEFIEKIVDELKRTLRPKGSLFFHISSKEMFVPFCILKDYFDFVYPIFWKKARSKNNVKNVLGSCVDVIFWCSKTKSPDYYIVFQPLDEKYKKGSYKNKDEKGYYALGHIVNTAPYASKNENRFYEVKINDRSFSAEFGWRVSKEELEKLISEDKIYIPKTENGNLYRKIYLEESKGKLATDLWDDIYVEDVWDDVYSLAQGKEKRIYPTQKPEKLLERIISMSSKEGDLVLDPMCGSGTTGVVAKRLNRDYIIIDINEDLKDIIEERLK